MLEMILCSMFTILPDYLFRRYVQGKRFGREITLYSVWFELRWGITACLILTVLLITLIFYFHPSTKNAISFFRTVPLLPEGMGRVEEIYVDVRDKVKAGQPIFKLDSSKQEAALETARRRIVGSRCGIRCRRRPNWRWPMAKSRKRRAPISRPRRNWRPRSSCSGVTQARSRRARSRNFRGLSKAGKARCAAAIANKQSIEAQISSLLPAQKASAEAARDAGPGRTGQDDGLRRRRRHVGAIHAAQEAISSIR